MSENLKHYQILIPVFTNAGETYIDERHTWEMYLFDKIGGFTRGLKVFGAWRDPKDGEAYWEEMIPYNVALSEDRDITAEEKFAEITAEAFGLFGDQKTFFIADLGTALIVERPRRDDTAEFLEGL